MKLCILIAANSKRNSPVVNLYLFLHDCTAMSGHTVSSHDTFIDVYVIYASCLPLQPSRRALADLSHNVVLPASATDVMSLRKCPGREARLERATVATARQQEKLGRGAAPPRAGQSQCSTTRPRLQHTPPPQSKTSGGEKVGSPLEMWDTLHSPSTSPLPLLPIYTRA